jgi:hypothetical protein
MKTQIFRMTDENGDEHEIELPIRMEVCEDCRGHGTRVNPAIDGNGLSADDFAEDPDFAEDYWAGRYDITCETCKGLRVVPEVDREKADPEDLALFDACEEVRIENARYYRESYLESQAERRFGA